MAIDLLSPPVISVVVIARNESSNLRRTVENLQVTLPERSEIMVVDDGSSDDCSDFLKLREAAHVRLIRSKNLGVARARNLGARETRGELVVFADAHIRLPPDWWRPLVSLLANPRIGAAAPAISDWNCERRKGFGLHLPGPELRAEWLLRQGDDPYPVPILPGCCLSMRRETFEATGGFDSGLISTGGVDNELGVRFWLLGYELWVVPNVAVAHLFRTGFPYPVIWKTALHNRLRLAFAHFSSRRIAEVLAALRGYDALRQALTLIIQSDIAAWRTQLASCRVRDDDWFFGRFGRGLAPASRLGSRERSSNPWTKSAVASVNR
jgi:glycosyltransferase involved in cell wall biosynthesis